MQWNASCILHMYIWHECVLLGLKLQQPCFLNNYSCFQKLQFIGDVTLLFALFNCFCRSMTSRWTTTGCGVDEALHLACSPARACVLRCAALHRAGRTAEIFGARAEGGDKMLLLWLRPRRQQLPLADLTNLRRPPWAPRRTPSTSSGRRSRAG